MRNCIWKTFFRCPNVLLIKYKYKISISSVIRYKYKWQNLHIQIQDRIWTEPRPMVLTQFFWNNLASSPTGLTHWGQDKMAAVSQTTFSKVFSWMKIYEFWLKFHWSLFLMVQLAIFHHWFRKWLGAVQATSHYLNQWWLGYWSIYASLGLDELMLWMDYSDLPACPDKVPHWGSVAMATIFHLEPSR